MAKNAQIPKTATPHNYGGVIVYLKPGCDSEGICTTLWQWWVEVNGRLVYGDFDCFYHWQAVNAALRAARSALAYAG